MITRAENYRARAEEMRAMADGMKDPDAKAIMMKLALNWDRMASKAETSAKPSSETPE